MSVGFGVRGETRIKEFIACISKQWPVEALVVSALLFILFCNYVVIAVSLVASFSHYGVP